jgi:diguanylate cyclase (GGDEF)-like protein/PAS domain S-box-containing protein
MNMSTARWEHDFDAANDDLGADIAIYRTLLESTLAIPWRIDWTTQEYSYIGPQVEALFGWKRREWKTISDWASRIHPDERDQIVHACSAQSIAGIDHEADFRMITQDGRYIWIRDIVHVVRDQTGKVDSLIGFMIDITPQKRAEHELLELKAKLETLSYQDGLTGVANRRLYNDKLDEAWNTAVRERSAIAIVLIDIDCFKQFNDFYGHIAGDECLIRVAGALAELGTADVVARYGGEEFALLLSGADEAAALALAERCRQTIEALAIPHERSDCSDVVTVSVGAASIVPGPESSLRGFCLEVDSLLYSAKETGRNRVVGDQTAGA